MGKERAGKRRDVEQNYAERADRDERAGDTALAQRSESERVGTRCSGSRINPRDLLPSLDSPVEPTIAGTPRADDCTAQ